MLIREYTIKVVIPRRIIAIQATKDSANLVQSTIQGGGIVEEAYHIQQLLEPVGTNRQRQAKTDVARHRALLVTTYCFRAWDGFFNRPPCRWFFSGGRGVKEKRCAP